MADVSVEFGASDTGLAQTLKNIQSELATLDAQQKTTAMSAEEFQKSLSKIKQLEGLETKIQSMATATTDAGIAASAASPKVDELGNSANNAGNKAENSAGMFDASFTKIAAAFTVGNLAAKGFEAIIDGVFSAGRAIVDGFGQALDLGGRLSELSARTGETAGNLLVLETAFKNAGLSGDQVGTVINKLQNFMQDAANGGATQKAAMDNLGVSLSELAGKTPTDQMGIFAAKIAAIEDPTARAAAASEVFGDKLGGKLLPLLTEFSPSLTDAAGKVGSLASVMDEHAGTFDAFGEKIDAVKGKFGAFAAGILSETIPALDDLGESVEEIDAAGLGQDIGTILNPAIGALATSVNTILNPAIIGAIAYIKDLNALLNATPEAGSAAAATYNAVATSLSGFNQMMADLFNTYTPLGIALTALVERGKEIQATQAAAAAAIAATGTAAAGATAPVDAFGVSLGNIKPPTGLGAGILEAEAPLQSILQLTGDYKANIDGLAPSMANVNGELDIGKGTLEETVPLTAELTAGTDTYAGALGGAAEQAAIMAGELNNAKATTEAITTSSVKSVQNQIALNNAILSGNTAEQERLQNLIAGEAQQKRINTLVQEYGQIMPLAQAQELATQMVNSETAVKGMKANMGQVETKTQTVNGLLAQMNQQQIDAPAQTLIQRLEAAQTKLSGMKQFVGVDMQNMPLESIIDKLGLDDYGLTTTESKLKLVEAAVTKLGDANPADLTPTVDEIGVNNELETVKGYLAAVTPPDATPTLDQTDVQNAATDAKDTLETELASVATVVTPTVDDPAKQAVRSDLEAAATNVPMTVDVAVNQQTLDNTITQINTGLDGINTPNITPTIGSVSNGVATTNTELNGIIAPNVTPSIGSISDGVATANTELDGIITPDVTPSINESDLSTAVADAKSTLETGLASVATVVTPTVDDTAKQAVRSDLETAATDVPMTVDVAVNQPTLDNAITQINTGLDGINTPDVTPSIGSVSNGVATANTELDGINTPHITPSIGSVSNGVATINTELDGIIAPDVTPSINESDLKTAVADANTELGNIGSQSITIDINSAAAIQKIKTDFNGLSPVTVDLEVKPQGLDDAITQINNKLAEINTPDVTPSIGSVSSGVATANTELDGIVTPNITPSIGSVSNGVATANDELDGIVTPDVTPSINESDLSTAVADAKNTLETGLASVATVVTPTVDDTAKQAMQSDLEAAATDVPMTVDVAVNQPTLDNAITQINTGIDGINTPNITPTIGSVSNGVSTINTELDGINTPHITPSIGSVSNGVSTINTELDGIVTPDVTPSINESDLSIAVADAKNTLETGLASIAAVVTVTVDDAAQQSARTELEAIATDVPMTVKADQAQIDSAVGALQAEITNNFTGGEGGQGGQGGNGGEGGRGGDANADVTSITSILNGWTDIISTIRDRLPMTALA